MLSLDDIIDAIERKSRKPDESELRKLPDRIAVIHGGLYRSVSIAGRPFLPLGVKVPRDSISALSRLL